MLSVRRCVPWPLKARGVVLQPSRSRRRYLRQRSLETALSHQPFLLPITWLTVGLGFNKFKALARRREAARKAFVARCDNARTVGGLPAASKPALPVGRSRRSGLAWVTMTLMFSSPLLRHTAARCQPARASSGVSRPARAPRVNQTRPRWLPTAGFRINPLSCASPLCHPRLLCRLGPW